MLILLNTSRAALLLVLCLISTLSLWYKTLPGALYKVFCNATPWNLPFDTNVIMLLIEQLTEQLRLSKEDHTFSSVVVVTGSFHLTAAPHTQRRNSKRELRNLKVYSSHLNWGARRDSFDPLLNTRCPASFNFFFNDRNSREEHKTN